MRTGLNCDRPAEHVVQAVQIVLVLDEQAAEAYVPESSRFRIGCKQEETHRLSKSSTLNKPCLHSQRKPWTRRSLDDNHRQKNKIHNEPALQVVQEEQIVFCAPAQAVEMYWPALQDEQVAQAVFVVLEQAAVW